MSLGCGKNKTSFINSAQRTRDPVSIATFFADEFLGGCAKVVVELPGLVVVHPSELHAVFVVLPVVRLVGRPGEEVLRGGQSKPALQCVLDNLLSRPAAAYRRAPVRVDKMIFITDVIQSDPGGRWHVSCGWKETPGLFKADFFSSLRLRAFSAGAHRL